MNTPEKIDQKDHDFRYDMLVKVLGCTDINIHEADWIDRWLVSETTERLMQNATANAFVNPKDSEKLRICDRLKTYASGISQQFGFLEQFSELDQIMRYAFTSIKKQDTATVLERKQWTEFREWMATGAKLLAEIADQTAKQIEEPENKKRGRPTDEWRNALVLHLYNHLASISNLSQNDCSLVTHSVFHIYFPDDCPNEPESMLKIVTREQKKEARTQSHKSV